MLLILSCLFNLWKDLRFIDGMVRVREVISTVLFKRKKATITIESHSDILCTVFGRDSATQAYSPMRSE